MPSDPRGSDPRTLDVESPVEDFAEIRRLLRDAIARASPGLQRDDVEDLTQRAIVRLMELNERLSAKTGFSRPYLYRVAYTQVVDEFRRRRREEPLDDHEMNSGETPSRTLDPERSTLGRELGAAIHQCLAKLTRDRQHAAVLMLLGHKNQEIATLTGWNAKQAENYVNRAKADLRRCLQLKGLQP